ncbi:MAG: zinc ribbon domain-containing protein [Syntrophaceae bacterium]|nr:zinc ribbon domain-containing protein [Syntrophaceae bacterium]
MPIYEYRCRKCGEVFEKIQKVSEAGESLRCPHCGEEKPERILSGFFSKGSESTSTCGPSGGSSRFS